MKTQTQKTEVSAARRALAARFAKGAKKAATKGDVVKYDHLAVLAERCLEPDVTAEELKFGRRIVRKLEG